MSRPILIAELSMNYLGSMSLASDMISAAAENGADYVKFQTWQVENLKSGLWDTDGRREQYEKSELSYDDHIFLIEKCKENNIKFLTSAFSIKNIDMLSDLISEIKIPGIECGNRDLCYAAIDGFERVFLSTCGSSYEEYSEYANKENVYLMHGVYNYPCDYMYANMPRMLELKKITDRFGYSGHCLGIDDAICAVTLGAKVIEKHFTTDKELPFVDNKFSILPEELAELRGYMDNYEKMMIDRGRDFQNIEKKIRSTYRGRWDK